MGLQYVVAKRVFGFDKDKNVKYVAKSVGSGELGTDKLCAKVSRILGIHRKTYSLLSGKGLQCDAGQDERHPDGNARYGLYRRQPGQ